MQLSWTALKISIAGARLSHLVQKDGIWDHGSMIEQVKIVFYQLNKAMRQGNAELLRKYMTMSGFDKARLQIANGQNETRVDQIMYELQEVDIIKIAIGKNSPDCFKALVKVKEKTDTQDKLQSVNKLNNFQEEWLFIRQGNWWMLDKIKGSKFFS